MTYEEIFEAAGIAPFNSLSTGDLRRLVDYMNTKHAEEMPDKQSIANQLRCWALELDRDIGSPDLLGTIVGMKEIANELAPEDPDFCPGSDDNVHVIDLGSLHINDDGKAAFVDCSCEKCGRSGCLAKIDLDAKVDW